MQLFTCTLLTKASTFFFFFCEQYIFPFKRLGYDLEWRTSLIVSCLSYWEKNAFMKLIKFQLGFLWIVRSHSE